MRYCFCCVCSRQAEEWSKDEMRQKFVKNCTYLRSMPRLPPACPPAVPSGVAFRRDVPSLAVPLSPLWVCPYSSIHHTHPTNFFHLPCVCANALRAFGPRCQSFLRRNPATESAGTPYAAGDKCNYATWAPIAIRKPHVDRHVLDRHEWMKYFMKGVAGMRNILEMTAEVDGRKGSPQRRVTRVSTRNVLLRTWTVAWAKNMNAHWFYLRNSRFGNFWIDSSSNSSYRGTWELRRWAKITTFTVIR